MALDPHRPYGEIFPASELGGANLAANPFTGLFQRPQMPGCAVMLGAQGAHDPGKSYRCEPPKADMKTFQQSERAASLPRSNMSSQRRALPLLAFFTATMTVLAVVILA